jgi:hypothetical protein
MHKGFEVPLSGSWSVLDLSGRYSKCRAVPSPAELQDTVRHNDPVPVPTKKALRLEQYIKGPARGLVDDQAIDAAQVVTSVIAIHHISANEIAG